MCFPLELPLKQGVLFSEDEDRKDSDEKISGLVAHAKITLFEV